MWCVGEQHTVWTVCCAGAVPVLTYLFLNSGGVELSCIDICNTSIHDAFCFTGTCTVACASCSIATVNGILASCTRPCWCCGTLNLSVC